MPETVIYVAAIIALIAVAIATAIIAVRRDGRDVDSLIKQLVIWVAIAALLPLTSYAGATLLHPRTKLDDLLARQQRVQEETYDTKEADARGKSRDQAEELRKEIEHEQRGFYRAMFWVASPIGYATLLIGLFLRTVPVGTGLAFGGLCTLTTGCYSYWNGMGDSLRFLSLLIVLVTVVAVGLVKFGPSRGVSHAQPSRS
ncbi:hypothetical protein TA3x_000387 [Tundrisphaera sp. TA3]|uniref:hypothetical protein n=1 Tax=Tundrisphaera sp. TA3 TaxID=3435775 RepID=UPI003EB9A6AE